MKGLVIIPVHLDERVNPLFLKPLAGRSPLGRTLDYSRTLSELPNITVHVAVATNDPAIAKECAKEEDVFLPARTEKGLNEALAEALEKSEQHFKCRFDLVFILEPPHPFRSKNFAAEAYNLLMNSPHLDSAFCAEQLHGRIWAGSQSLQPLPNFPAKNFYDDQAPFIELLGIMLVSRRHVIAAGERVGEHVGLVVVDRKWRFADIHSEESFRIAEQLESLFCSITGT